MVPRAIGLLIKNLSLSVSSWHEQVSMSWSHPASMKQGSIDELVRLYNAAFPTSMIDSLCEWGASEAGMASGAV